MKQAQTGNPPAPQCVKEPMLSRSESMGFPLKSGKQREKASEKGVLPTPICQLFRVHGSEFKPDPSCDGGQASVVCITHRVFLSMGSCIRHPLLQTAHRICLLHCYTPCHTPRCRGCFRQLLQRPEQTLFCHRLCVLCKQTAAHALPLRTFRSRGLWWKPSFSAVSPPLPPE